MRMHYSSLVILPVNRYDALKYKVGVYPSRWCNWSLFSIYIMVEAKKKIFYQKKQREKKIQWGGTSILLYTVVSKRANSMKLFLVDRTNLMRNA